MSTIFQGPLQLYIDRVRMEQNTAQSKMKAMVAARLLLGDFDDWGAFQQERETASKIINRRIARSVSAQIGRKYKKLSLETWGFLSENFLRCDYKDLSILCDAIPVGIGIYERLDEFESHFFPLADKVKSRFPFYAHVSISLYGLQFEFPEHHFLQDLDSSIKELTKVRTALSEYKNTRKITKEQRDSVGEIISRDKFLSRIIISASFSLLESFLSGLFFTALQKENIGSVSCDEDFLNFSRRKESASLRHRLDKVVTFLSNGKKSINHEPFISFIEEGKRYRDAIHHTTPFERKEIEAGGRLLSLYKIDGDTALQIALHSLDAILEISCWLHPNSDSTVIAAECRKLKDIASELLSSPLINST